MMPKAATTRTEASSTAKLRLPVSSNFMVDYGATEGQESKPIQAHWTSIIP